MPALMLLALLACGSPENAVVLTGWNYSWETLSHRVGYLRTVLHQDTSLDLGLIGGDWSTGETGTDTPSYRVGYAEVAGTGWAFAEGEVVFDVGPDPEGSATLHVDAAPEGDELVALVQGFWIDCDIPQSAEYPADYPARYGYTSNGFGVTLGAPTRVGDGVDVPVDAIVRWGPQDREDMNAAIPYAVTEVGVHVLVVAADRPIERAGVSGAADYPFEPPYTDQPSMTAAFSLDGAGADAFVGWTAWRLDANLTGPDAGEGDYLRAMGVEAKADPADRGAVSGVATATISNSSIIELTQFSVGFEGDLARVPIRGGAVEPHTVEGSHPVGPATAAPAVDG